MVDAIGLETDFTLETNRNRMKEKLLKRTLTLEFHLSDLKFLTIMNSEMEEKTCILHSPSILKHILGVQDHSGTLQKKHSFVVFLDALPSLAFKLSVSE